MQKYGYQSDTRNVGLMFKCGFLKTRLSVTRLGKCGCPCVNDDPKIGVDDPKINVGRPHDDCILEGYPGLTEFQIVVGVHRAPINEPDIWTIGPQDHWPPKSGPLAPQ